MRNQLIHLALAFVLVATYAVAQQPAATAPATQGQQAQQPAATAPTPGQQTQQPNTSSQPATAGAQAGAAAGQTAAAGAPNASVVLQNEIEQAFRTEPSLANKVNVNVANNQVVLSGTVITPEEKKTAQQVAEAYANGMPVVNNVNITSSTSAAATATGTSNPTAGQAQPPAAGAAQPGTAGGVSGTAAGQTQPPAGAQPGAAGAVGSQAGTAATPPQSAQPAPGTAAQGAGVGPDHLQADIQGALQREPTLSACNLTTNVTSDSVELAGTCPTAQEKQTAVRLAQSFAGNRRVVDRITLGGGTQGQGAGQPTPPSQATPPPR